MKSAVAVVALVLVAALAALDARQSSPQALFEKALALEEVQGKITEAIDVYERVVRESADKALAARAQLRIGLCYEKLSLEKAREAYEKVIKNYPGQTAAVAAARERLDNLLRAASLARKGEGDITIRKVLTPKGLLMTWAVSPDGKYLADMGNPSGSTPSELRITEIATGKERLLRTENPDCSRRIGAPRWSPDSTKLVVWSVGGLCVVPLDGSAARIFFGTPPDKTLFYPLDWSPDQKHILVSTYGTEKPLGLSLIAVANGSHRRLKIGDSPAPFSFDCRFSPDGLTVACDRGITSSDIFLLAVDGSRETPLVEHPADDALLEWLPDGRGILFASDRAGTIDMWSQPIEGGQPKGAPVLVRRNIGSTTPMRLTKSGAFYYQTPASSGADVYTISLDPKTGRITGPPRKEPLPWEGHNGSPDWSPDGKRLAYVVSNKPAVVGVGNAPGRSSGNRVVCIYSVDTGRVREYSGVHLASLRWSPDGRYVYVAATNVSGGGIHRIDVESGAITPVMLDARGLGFDVSADGPWMVFCRDDRLLGRNLQSGEEKELDGPGIYPAARLALSRDGSRLAWVVEPDEKTKVLKVMPFPDGTPKEVQGLRDPESRIAWSPDGRFIYYSDVPPAGGNVRHLWRVPADGGTAQDLGSAANSHEHLTVHPDGTRITFSTRTLNPEPALLWVLENFLPARK